MRVLINMLFIFSTLIGRAQYPILVEDFFCSDCGREQLEDELHFRHRIIDSCRIDDVYKIKIAVLTNCGTGSYYDALINGDTLVLSYGIAPGYGHTFCVCPFSFEYQILNVPNKKLHVKIYDNTQPYLGKRLIPVSSFIYTSEYYDEGLTEDEYRFLFLEKLEREKMYLERIVAVMRELIGYLENGGCDEDKISSIIAEYDSTNKEGEKYIWKSVDAFIKDVLGESFVNARSEELRTHIEKSLPEYRILREKMEFYGVMP